MTKSSFVIEKKACSSVDIEYVFPTHVVMGSTPIKPNQNRVCVVKRHAALLVRKARTFGRSTCPHRGRDHGPIFR